MESTLPPGKTASAIWGRVVNPEQADLSPEAARAILELDFDADDHQRMGELSAKARQGDLTAEEREEMDEYLRVGSELAVLQSKARMSLQRAKSPR
jgi:hypothetical protein